VEFGDPEHIEFDTDDLIDAAVEVYLNPRKSSPTTRDPRQFGLTLEDLRRRAGVTQIASFATAAAGDQVIVERRGHAVAS
jgi:hypothetical protein